MEKFDIYIIGGGPGGYVAAIRAAQLGYKVGLAEKDKLGGICLNWGCIPTKALLRSAEIVDYIKQAKDYGLKETKVSFDIENIVKRSRDVASKLNAGVGHLMKKNGITIHNGKCSFIDKNNLKITTNKEGVKTEAANKTTTTKSAASNEILVFAKHIIIATGARARTLPGLEFSKNIWSYREAMVPKFVPKSILVIGSGAIGIEFASIYNSLGAKVNVVEILPQILVTEDEEVSAFAKNSLVKRGIDIHVSSKVLEVKSSGSGCKVEIEDAKKKKFSLKPEVIIVAAGVIGNTEELGLEKVSVENEKNTIKTFGFGQTSQKNIYAIGDVAGPPMLAHKAEHEGILCVEKIKGIDNLHDLDKNQIAGCIYSKPQIASIGITEQFAKKQGIEVKIGKFPFMANGKAIALGETEGFIKTIFCLKTGQLLGAHLIGAEVTELIQGFSIAMKLETTEQELMHCVFPHPTLSEMMHESVLAAFNKAIHI